MRTYDYTLEDVEHFAQYFAPLVHDPHATRSFHVQCSSFYWTDEMPEVVDDGYNASIRHFTLYLLGYRKMLMYGDDAPAFLPLWHRLKERCPNWPGFRADRMDVSLIPELEAKIETEFARIERILNVCKRRQDHRARLAAGENPKPKTT